MPDIISARYKCRDPEDLGPRELCFGHPDTGLGGGHDQRPGVGEPQGGGEVDREAEVGGIQASGCSERVGRQDKGAGRDHRRNRCRRTNRPGISESPRVRSAAGTCIRLRRRAGWRSVVARLTDEQWARWRVRGSDSSLRMRADCRIGERVGGWLGRQSPLARPRSRYLAGAAGPASAPGLGGWARQGHGSDPRSNRVTRMTVNLPIRSIGRGSFPVPPDRNPQRSL